MTQNARVARWIPTADPDEIGDGIITLNPPTVSKSIETEFSLAAGGGGIGDAPSDGSQYGRQDGIWTPVISGSGPATGITVTPVGDIAATDVQAALAELDAEKVKKSGDTMTGHLVLPTGPAAADAVRKDYVDAADGALSTLISLKAPTNSPAFTGTPTVPQPPIDDNSSKIPTTNWVQSEIGQAVGAIDLSPYAPKASPTFTGDPQAPTPSPGDNDTSIATTAFVTAADAVLTTAINNKVNKGGDTLVGGNFHWSFVAPGAGSYYSTNVTVDRFFVGTDSATDIFRIYSSGLAGNAFTVDGPTGKASVALDPTTALGIATKNYVDTKAPAIATAAEYRANVANRMLTTDQVWAAAAPVALVDAASVAPDFSLGIDFSWNVAAAGRTLANPTNVKAGQKGLIRLINSAGTVTTWGTAYKFPGGTKPTSVVGQIDLLSYVVIDASNIYCSALANFS